MAARIKTALLCEEYLRPFFKPGRPHFKIWGLLKPFETSSVPAVPIEIAANSSDETTTVDDYWADHTVQAFDYQSKLQSRMWLAFRFQLYPQFKQFMELYGDHAGETVLDFGCGPGNDVLGFALYSRAKKVVGIDVSPKALEIAKQRLALHGIGGDRVELKLSGDSGSEICLPDRSVDYIYCEGVLMHTSRPEDHLRQFHRILKPGGRGHIMVYNRDSVWYHLYSSYVLKIVRKKFADLTDMEAFQRSTDGESCPLARNYAHPEFLEMLRTAGFRADYVGGYLSLHELKIIAKHYEAALKDERLAPEHREFLARLQVDADGFPAIDGKSAGIGGVYAFIKDPG
jgi:ubiquinone/menaquinone biosynthesis C-methylase UbiE